MPAKRAHILYSGMVQGIGFRWTAQNAANSSAVKGWVRNLPDGRVEVLCEGKEQDIKKFMNKIKDEIGAYIRSSDIIWQESTGEFDSFNIKYFNRP